MATPQVLKALGLFDSWYVTLTRDNPGMTREGIACALFVEFDTRGDELLCCATWYKELVCCAKNPGMTTEGLAFALFLEKMKNEPLQPTEELEEFILQIRNAFEQRYM
jgi:hypothetical protein